MSIREKVEKGIKFLEEANMVLHGLLGELDAIRDFSEYQRGKFTIIEGGKGKSQSQSKQMLHPGKKADK